MAAQSVADVLSGAFGHAVDRPAMNAFVANSQATNGLRSAQTDEALLNAQKAIDAHTATQALKASLKAQYVNDGQPESTAQVNADAAGNIMIGHYGNAEQAAAARQAAIKAQATGTLADPTKIGTPAATAAGQALENKPASPFQAVPTDYVPTPGMPAQPPTQVNPSGQASINAQNAIADLHGVQAAAGGWNPHVAGAGLGLSDEDSALLNKAVNDGRLNPDRINSRTAGVFASLEHQNGGTINYNAEAAKSAAQRNVGLQSKMVGYEAMPTILSHMTTLGKALENGTGYSDNRTVGRIQKFWNGEFNDPAYQEYMTVRNDALMKIASLMRGQGMSDQAHTAEIEAAAPTLSPLALDAWLKGQMSSLKPYFNQAQTIGHHGEAATNANIAAHGGAAPQAADPLGIR